MRNAATAVAIAATLSFSLGFQPAEAGTWDEDEEVCQTVPPGFWGGFLHLLGLGSC